MIKSSSTDTSDLKYKGGKVLETVMSHLKATRQITSKLFRK